MSKQFSINLMQNSFLLNRRTPSRNRALYWNLKHTPSLDFALLHDNLSHAKSKFSERKYSAFTLCRPNLSNIASRNIASKGDRSCADISLASFVFDKKRQK
jgi:hypothetical protein